MRHAAPARNRSCRWTTPTSTPFAPFPGFRASASYPEYSADFFDGDHFVLLGGSWATDETLLRPSFRNWDHPFRRQIFSGVRLAWDVPDAGDPA